MWCVKKYMFLKNFSKIFKFQWQLNFKIKLIQIKIKSILSSFFTLEMNFVEPFVDV